MKDEQYNKLVELIGEANNKTDEKYNKLVELIEGTNERIDSTNQRISEMEERYLSYEIGQVKKMVRDESRINGRQHQAIIQLVENRYNELDDRIKVANL